LDLQIPIALFVLLISLVVHESAHAYAALRLGDDTALRMGRLTLNPVAHLDPVGSILVPAMGLMMGGFVIGWAKPVPVNTMRLRNPIRDHAIVAAAGPASNLLLALISAILLGLLTGWAHGNPGAAGPGDGLAFLGLLFRWGITLNVLLAVFNLIPLPPLDGSWILLTFLKGEAAEFYMRLRPYGFLLILALLFLGLRHVLWAVVDTVSGGYYDIVFAVARLF
jgi:Zn-dependent protease